MLFFFSDVKLVTVMCVYLISWFNAVTVYLFVLVLYQVDKVMILTKGLVQNVKKNSTKVA